MSFYNYIILSFKPFVKCFYTAECIKCNLVLFLNILRCHMIFYSSVLFHYVLFSLCILFINLKAFFLHLLKLPFVSFESCPNAFHVLCKAPWIALSQNGAAQMNSHGKKIQCFLFTRVEKPLKQQLNHHEKVYFATGTRLKKTERAS